MNKEEKVLTTGTAVLCKLALHRLQCPSLLPLSFPTCIHYTGYSAPLFSLSLSLPASTTQATVPLSLPASVTSNHVAIVMLEVTDASCHIVSIILHPFSLHTSVKVSVCEKEDR